MFADAISLNQKNTAPFLTDMNVKRFNVQDEIQAEKHLSHSLQILKCSSSHLISLTYRGYFQITRRQFRYVCPVGISEHFTDKPLCSTVRVLQLTIFHHKVHLQKCLQQVISQYPMI